MAMATNAVTVMNANRSPRPSFTRSSSKQKVSPSGARASRVTQRSETFVVTNPTTVREKLYALFEDPSSGYWAKKLAGTILILILISIVSFIGETMLWVEQFIPPNGWFWFCTEWLTTGAFTMEYCVRFIVADVKPGQTRLKFVLSTQNLFDFLAILPAYIDVLAGQGGLQDMQALRVLRAVRLARIFRLFRLGKYAFGFRVMATTMSQTSHALYILQCFVIVFVVVFSSVAYYAEKFQCPAFGPGQKDEFLAYQAECIVTQRQASAGWCCAYWCSDPDAFGGVDGLCKYGWNFEPPEDPGPEWLNAGWGPVLVMHPLSLTSIPESMWWAFVTMTTVGYGDIVPVTSMGKIIGAITIVCGILLIALPVAIVGSKFQEVYMEAEVQQSRQRRRARAEAMRKDGAQAADRKLRFRSVKPPPCEIDGLTTKDLERLSKDMVDGCADVLAEPAVHLGEAPMSPAEQWSSEAEQEAYARSSPEGPGEPARELVDKTRRLNTSIVRLLNTKAVMLDQLLRENAVREKLHTEMFAVMLGLYPDLDPNPQMALSDSKPNSPVKNAWSGGAEPVPPPKIGSPPPSPEAGPQSPQSSKSHPLQRKQTKYAYDCEKSLYIFHLHSPIRKFAISVVENKWFDRIVLTLILLNSLILANLSKTDDTGTHWSLRLNTNTELTFTTLFTLECVFKIIALGFFMDKGSYLRDPWNWLDFTVVMAGLIQLFAGADSGIAVLRVFRVLRPLRSVSALPGMRLLVNAVLLSIPRLARVGSMAIFLLILFGVMGIQFWAGTMHRRCRVTQEPIRFVAGGCQGGFEYSVCLDPTDTEPRDSYPPGASVFAELCELDVLCDPETWATKTEPFDLWVVDEAQDRLCSGAYKCGDMPSTPIFQELAAALQLNRPLSTNVLKRRRSNTDLPAPDDYANLQFLPTYCGNGLAGDGDLSRPGPEHLSGTNATFDPALTLVPDLNSGISHFDHFPGAMLVVFQSSTLEGWTDIMYMLQDGWGSAFPVLYFFFIVLVTNFFLLNITLAVVWEAYQENVEPKEDEAEEEVQSPSAVENRVTRPEIHSEEPFSFRNLWGLRKIAITIWDSEPFQMGIMAVIVLNVITLSMDTYPPPSELVQSVLGVCNIIFTAIFIFEFAVGNIALGLKEFWTTMATAFDGVIVIISIVEFAASDSSVMTGLRGFRLLRIFKLAKKWESFRNLLSAIVATLKQMGNFLFLLAVMIFVFTLMGQEFFAAKFNFDDQGRRLYGDDLLIPECERSPINGVRACTPRHHFDTFQWGFVCIFQILSGENWNEVMYDGMRSVGWFGCSFFIAVVVIGSFIVFNLFLAILMSGFEEESNKVREREKKKKEAKLKEAETKETQGIFLKVMAGQKQSIQSAARERKSRMSLARNLNFGEDEEDENRGLFFVPKPVVQILQQIVTNPKFDTVILVFIIISSLLMAFDDPLSDPRSVWSLIKGYCDLCFTVIFLAECVFKIMAWGFLCGRKAYLKSGWNILDFIIVAFSLLDLALKDQEGIGLLKTARILRALRPLRLISRYPNLKLVVSTLLRAIPELANLIIVGSLFFLIFGLLAVALFKGSFAECMAPTEVEHYPLDTPGLESMDLDYALPNPLPLCRRDDGSAYICEDGEEGQLLRSTTDTPVCMVDCSPTIAFWAQIGNSLPTPAICDQKYFPYVEKDSGLRHPATPSTWGFKVMPCADCAAVFTGQPGCDADEKTLAMCDTRCRGGPGAPSERLPFCEVEACANGPSEACEQCIEACIGQCRCNSYCHGFSAQAGMCIEQGGRWVTRDRNFDHAGSAMRTLFEIATTEGWVDTMYDGVDSVGPMMQPVRDNRQIVAWAFVMFIMFGTFFILNLCVGVIIDNFNNLRKERGTASLFLTPAQEKYLESQKAMNYFPSLFPVSHLNKFPPMQRALYDVTSNPVFEGIIVVCIVFNTVVAAVVKFPSTDEYDRWLDYGNNAMAVAFNMEFILKFYALRSKYFVEAWNCFDCFCVFATNTGVVLVLFFDMELGPLLSCLRFLRIARIFRLIRFLHGLSTLFSALILSIPKLMNVGIVLCLLLFLYAVLGVGLFGKVRYYNDHNEQANFRNFGSGIITLVRSMTGEGWNFLMHDLSRSKFFFETYLDIPCETDMAVTAENYDELLRLGYIDNPYQCGMGDLSMLYFISYTANVSFVILNLFIAVIFEGFEDSQKAEEREVVTLCVEEWRKRDPDLAMTLPLEDAMAFITKCVSETEERRGETPTVGTINLRQGDATREALKVASELRISVDGEGKVHVFVAITAVLRKCVLISGPDALGEMDDLDRHATTNSELRMMGMSSSAKKKAEKMVNQGGEVIGLDQSFATVLIQRRFRQIVEEKRAVKEDIAEGVSEEEQERRKSVRRQKRATENAVGMLFGGSSDQPVSNDGADADDPSEPAHSLEDKVTPFGVSENPSKPESFGALGSRPNSRADGFNAANSGRSDIGSSPERPRSRGKVRVDGVTFE
jgi:hypothetical protein